MQRKRKQLGTNPSNHRRHHQPLAEAPQPRGVRLVAAAAPEALCPATRLPGVQQPVLAHPLHVRLRQRPLACEWGVGGRCATAAAVLLLLLAMVNTFRRLLSCVNCCWWWYGGSCGFGGCNIVGDNVALKGGLPAMVVVVVVFFQPFQSCLHFVRQGRCASFATVGGVTILEAGSVVAFRI